MLTWQGVIEMPVNRALLTEVLGLYDKIGFT